MEKSLKFHMFLGFLLFTLIFAKDSMPLSCIETCMNLDTLSPGVVEVQRGYGAGNDSCAITSIDTFSQAGLLDSLNAALASHKYAIIGQVTSVIAFPDSGNDSIIIVPSSHQESVLVTVEDDLLNTLPVNSIWFTVSLSYWDLSFNSLLNKPFIAFFNEYDEFNDLGVGPAWPCQSEENGFFIEDSQIVKKGGGGMPGISIQENEFLDSAGPIPNDRVIVTPDPATSNDSLHFSLFLNTSCCCIAFHNRTVNVQDTAIYLSFESDMTSCAVCGMCQEPGMWVEFDTGPAATGTYAIYKVESYYCAPGDPCPMEPVIPVRVGEVTILQALAVKDPGKIKGDIITIRPNPFSTSVDILVRRPSSVARHEVRLEVFNIAGKMVANIKPRTTSDERRATNYTWSPRTSPNGIYIIKIKTGSQTKIRKVTLVR